MSVNEGKMFQCSICNEVFNSKITLESHCAKEHDSPKLKRKKQITARFCETEQIMIEKKVNKIAKKIDTVRGSDQTTETKPTEAKKVQY